MTRFLLHEIDSVPFFLQKKEEVTNADTTSITEFGTYEYVPLDSTQLFYDVSTIKELPLNAGLKATMRPLMQQWGGALFVLFTFFFVCFALVFRNRRQVLIESLANIFTTDTQVAKIHDKEITTSDVWANLFFILQTFTLYSLLFFDIAHTYSLHYFSSYDNMLLFAQIFIAFFVLAIGKYLFYQLMNVIFSNSSTNILIDTYLWVIYLTGILSFIPIVIYFYVLPAKMIVLLYLVAVFIGGRIIVFTKTYTFFVKSHIGILYFFIYLCALEIMPYILMYKMAISIN